jgi:hypothetical protein
MFPTVLAHRTRLTCLSSMFWFGFHAFKTPSPIIRLRS